jgi:drug/metabolite transporter (DMT)-like permease
MTRHSQPFGVTDLTLLGLVLIWGANFSVVKSALSELPPLAFNALRFGAASLLTLLLTWLVEKDLHIERQDWPLLIVMALVANSAYQILFIQGIARTRASNSSLILATPPIWVALFSALTHSERLSRRNGLGILLSFAGLCLLIGGSRSGLSLGVQTFTGDLLTLCAALIWATHTLVVKRFTRRNSALKVTTWMLVFGTIPLIAIGYPDLVALDWSSISAESWLGLAYSTVLAIALGYVIWNTSVERIGSTRTAIYSYLQPLIGVGIAWATLGETMQPLQALGAVGILAGVALARQNVAK